MMVEEVSVLLKQLGLSANLNGFERARYAIILVYEKPDLAHHMTTQVYPLLAHHYKTNDKNIERSIRSAIEAGWTKADIRLVHHLFEYTIDQNKDRPTNAQFIAILADHLRVKHK